MNQKDLAETSSFRIITASMSHNRIRDFTQRVAAPVYALPVDLFRIAASLVVLGYLVRILRELVMTRLAHRYAARDSESVHVSVQVTRGRIDPARSFPRSEQHPFMRFTCQNGHVTIEYMNLDL